jgi:hypothetical protein
MRKFLARWGPWVLAAALLALLLGRGSVRNLPKYISDAAPWTIPAALASLVAIYIADSFAMWKTFGWFLARLSFLDVLVVRGGTYLLAILHYAVGQGTIVYFVHRATGVSVARGTATVLLIMGINVLALLFLTTAGLAIAPEIPHSVAMVTALAWAGLGVYVVAMVLRPRWLAARQIFEVLLSAKLGGHLRTLAVRLPHIAALLVFQVAMLYAFGIPVPLRAAIVELPVVFFVAALPITPQGLGTTQAAMVLFFARYAPGGKDQVMAASLATQGMSSLVQAGIGLLCMRSRVGRELRTAASRTETAVAAVSRAPTGG